MSETPDNPPAATDSPDFETALEELETLVEQLEGGQLSLEDSLKAYERGVALTRHCQDALPGVADVVVPLTKTRQVAALQWRHQ